MTAPPPMRLMAMESAVWVAGRGSRGAYLKQFVRDKLIEHEQHITRHGEDVPEIRGCLWRNQD